MFLTFVDFLKKAYPFVIEGFLLFIIFIIIFRFSARSRKILNFIFIYVILLLVLLLTYKLNYTVAYTIYRYICLAYPIVVVMLLAPDMRRVLDSAHKREEQKSTPAAEAELTRKAIVDAVLELSKKRIGALITIERYASLDQYSSKAIPLDSVVTKELLINIFTPLTPLHDGAVIIRGTRISCAGAYFVLTEGEVLDKTTGSRHRAARGISEVTDSLTIVCSEETGDIHLAIDGGMYLANNPQTLTEYLELYVKE